MKRKSYFMIAFIGLGIMGKLMARNLLTAGYEVMVYNIDQDSVDDVVSYGAIAGGSASDVDSQLSVVITMLPISPEVIEVVMGKGGVLEGGKGGMTLIDMSSIAPATSERIEKACCEKGVQMLDGPVSGGEKKAIDGTLSIMVEGNEYTFLKMKVLLLHMGSSVVLCGQTGPGNTTKLAKQVIVALKIAALSEALTLAKKADVDPQFVLEAIRGGLAGSTVMNAKAPIVIADNFKPGFRNDLHIKDFQNANDTGHDIGAPLPLTAAVQEMLSTLHADGMGGDDHSGLANYYAKVCNVRISGQGKKT